MSERLEKIIFGLCALAFVAVLIFCFNYSEKAEQPEPAHQEVVTDFVEVHQASVEAVAAAPEIPASYASDSINEAAPAYLGITNHQTHFNPLMPVLDRSFIDGNGGFVTKRFLNRRLETLEEVKQYLSQHLSASEEKQLRWHSPFNTHC